MVDDSIAWRHKKQLGIVTRQSIFEFFLSTIMFYFALTTFRIIITYSTSLGPLYVKV